MAQRSFLIKPLPQYENYGGDWCGVEASTPQEAAKKFIAEIEWASCDYVIASGREEVILSVVAPGDTKAITIKVTGDPTPTYIASIVA